MFGRGDGEDFESLSNFVIDIMFEVDAGPQSGFVADVTFQNGEHLG